MNARFHVLECDAFCRPWLDERSRGLGADSCAFGSVHQFCTAGFASMKGPVEDLYLTEGTDLSMPLSRSERDTGRAEINPGRGNRGDSP